MSNARNIGDSASVINFIDNVTSDVQTQINTVSTAVSNINVTSGSQTKTYAAGEVSTITLTGSVLSPIVGVTKEVNQTGVTNNDWNVNSNSENYTRYNSAGTHQGKTFAITVAGGKFYVDGAQQATLNLVEGNTYTFDQSDSTNAGHPLRFSTTSDGTHGGGSEYTTGVTTNGTPGSANAYTRIAVAASAPTLYYYCTNHSGMGGTANTLAAATLDFDTYDVSTASFVDSFSIGSQDSNPNGLAFNADGTKMYIAGRTNDAIFEYALSTAFDVSTASYTQNLSVSSRMAQPSGLSFNTDGTKMFVIDFDGDDVNEYALSTGFDISTASYTQNFSVSAKETQPQDVVFNNDGTKMFIVGPSSDFVHQYALSTGFDVSTASFTQSFDVGSQESSPRGLTFNPTGTKMFIVGTTGQDVNEYALTTAFDISTASYTQNFSVSSQDTAPKCIRFNTDGTKMFILGDTDDDIYEYTLSLGKVSLGSGSFVSADVGKVIEANSGVFLLTSTAGAVTQVTAPTSFSQVAAGSWQLYGLQFNTTDGDLELAGNVTRDFTAATKLDDFDIGQSEGTPTGLAFNPDGTVMIVSGDTQNRIFQYTLSTGFDLTTASYASKSYDASGLDSSPKGVRFNNDGTKLMWIGESNRRVYAVPLTTAYDLSTASGYASFNISSSQTTDPTGLEFNPDGTIMYVMGRDGSDEIFQYTLTTGFDVTTASYASKSFSLSSQQSDPRGLFINSTGTKFYVVGHSVSTVYEYQMSTPYDISTASYTNNNYSHSSGTQDATGIFFSPEATGKMYILGQSNDYVVEYSILSATYPTTGYHAAHTALSTDSTYWTDINSMTASESAGSGNIYYCVSTDDRTTWKVAKGTDGERSIVRNNSGTWQYNSNGTYGSTTWANASVNEELYAIQEAMTGASTTVGTDDVTTASLVHSLSVSSQTTSPEAIAFNSTGTRMIVGDTQNSRVLEYHLSTGFDLSTASYNSQLSPGIGRIDGIAFNPDGTKMYLVSYSNASIHQYALSTGFDVSTAGSAVGTYNTSGVTTNMRGLQLNNDGTKVYTISDNDDQIEEFNLSTAYDITTASHESSTAVNAQANNAQDFCFNGDGTKLFVADETVSSGTVFQYSLSTAYDTSTLSYDNKSFATGNGIAGIFVHSDGSKLYGTMNGDDSIKQYSLGTLSYPNQMNKTQLDAIPDANQFALANDLDLAIIMNQSSGARSLPSSDGVAINYDANVLNQSAVLGTDYTYDHPAGNKVRVKSLNAANLKIRIV